MNTRGDAAQRHVPVLRDRIVELLEPALQPSRGGLRRRHPRDGWPRRGDPRALPARPGRRASTATRRPSTSRASGSPASVTGSRRPRRLRRDRRGPGRALGLGTVARRPLRPRGLLAAARRGGPRLRLPARRAARHADGPVGRASPRPTSSTPTTHGDLARILRDVRRGAVRRARSPRPSSASATQEPFSTSGTAGRAAPLGRSPRRRSAAAGTRPSAPSRRCASRSTPSWPPGSRAAGGDRRPRRRRPDRGAQLPLAGGPDHQAGARRRRRIAAPRPGCRSSCPSTPHTCGCSPAAPRSRARQRSPRTPAPRRPGCARPNECAGRVPSGRDRQDEGTSGMSQSQLTTAASPARVARSRPSGVCRAAASSGRCGSCPPRSGVPATGSFAVLCITLLRGGARRPC